MHVLFLTPWYPNRSDAMDGIFVRKHAQAVARAGATVTVLRVHTDHEAKRIETSITKTDGVDEILVYTPEARTALSRLITPAINFARGFIKGYRTAVRLNGKPDVTQVNILTRMGVMAWILEKTHGVPYAIMEHWGRYQPWRGEYRGSLRRLATEVVCKSAKCVMTVSADLADVMRRCGIGARRWVVTRNVVNDFFYSDRRTERRRDEPFRLLCVTTADERVKNTAGLIRSLKRVKDSSMRFHLTIAGLEADSVGAVSRAIRELGMESLVTFAGEVPPESVSMLMHNADALVMFSNSENAPCVISEALASGTPIVATRVGGIPEMVGDTTGVLVPPQDEGAMANALRSVISGQKVFCTEDIRKAGEEYNFDRVGRQLVDIYKESVKR